MRSALLLACLSACLAPAQFAWAATDTTPPSVEIVRPAGGASVSGLELVEVKASDDTGVHRLALTIDGVVVSEALDTEQLFYAWDTDAAALGSTPALVATAEDVAGNTAQAAASVVVAAEDPNATGAPLGMLPFSPDGSVVSPSSPFADARSNGAKILYWSVEWSDAVSTPEGIDELMRLLGEGGATAVTLAVIRATVLASYPAPYLSFTDPGFAEAFSDFAASFAARHDPTYLFVGNEANIYLRNHPADVDAYRDVIRLTREKVHAANPATRVGVVLHYSLPTPDSQELALLGSLADEADLVGYTAYGFRGDGSEMRFDDPTQGIRVLDALPSVLPGKPFAVVETGWNTSEYFGSSDALQTTFIRLLRSYARRSPAEFLSLFLYADGQDCTPVVLERLADPTFNPDPIQLAVFAEFLCRLGLRRIDGSAKEAWSYLSGWPVPEPSALSGAFASLVAMGWLAQRRRGQGCPLRAGGFRQRGAISSITLPSGSATQSWPFARPASTTSRPAPRSSATAAS